MRIVEDIRLVISRERIFRLLGYKQGRTIPVRARNRVEGMIRHSSSLIKPRVIYTEKRIKDGENGSLVLEGDIALESCRLTAALKKCGRAVVFLATVGKELDDKIRELIGKNKAVDACLYDAMGSAAVENTVDAFQDMFDMAARGKSRTTTLRFSPGYCDWEVKEQRKLFHLVDNALIDVELTPHCLMVPRKSVSGVFGIGSIGEVDKGSTNMCRMCGMRNCIARRA